MTAAATTSSTGSVLVDKRRELLSLDTQKKSLQSEAEAIVSELTAKQPGGASPIGIDTPLVDAEGYPRADIDIYRARTLRKRFKEIQTDMKTLSKQIERGLIEVAALTKSCSISNNIGDQKASINNGTGNAAEVNVNDEEETKARLEPKPKPKFDPKTGKWVVKSWDGSIAGVENGESRSFDDLGVMSNGALACNIGIQSSGSNKSNNSRESENDTPGRMVEERNINIVGGQSQEPQQQNQVSFLEDQSTTPFAMIDEVSPNSPASEAGIKVNDVLIRFGSVDSTNHREFRAIAELLPSAASENKTILVAVRRKTSELGGLVELTKTEVLELKPRVWGGRGLLGCHIRPYYE